MSTESSIASHPRRADLAAVVRTLAISAADERRSRVGDGLDELVKEHRLGDSDGRVGEVDVLAALRRVDGGERPNANERAVLARLLSMGVADGLRGEGDEPDAAAFDAVAASVVWLAAHTFLDALPTIDETFSPEHAAAFWEATHRLVKKLDAEGLRGGRAEALLALSALVASESPAADDALEALAGELVDPALRAWAEFAVDGALADESDGEAVGEAPSGEAVGDAASTTDVDGRVSSSAEDEEEGIATRPRQRRSAASIRRVSVAGEGTPFPLSPLGVVLGAVTGYLVLRSVARLVSRYVLRAGHPIEVRVEATGITVSSRVEVLGRTIRTSETTVPFANLALLAREAKFPRLGLYAGLLGLAVGTFLGVSLIADGASAGSPSMIGLGASVVAAGVALDMLLSSIGASASGRHRLLIVPRRGRRFAVSVEDARAADDALRAVAERAG